MLAVSGLAKHYDTPRGRHVLFDGLSFELPRTGRLAVLGRNGQGKSTLIKILGGILTPSAGRAVWTMAPSWPLGFLSRIYDRPMAEIEARTEDFAELGDALTMPVKHYSSGMRARLAFGLSLAIEFDCYLIDEIIAVGDVSFQRKCHAELFERRADRAFIIASHDLALVKATCDRAIIIEDGRAKLFDDIDTALEIHAGIGTRRRDETRDV